MGNLHRNLHEDWLPEDYVSGGLEIVGEFVRKLQILFLGQLNAECGEKPRRACKSRSIRKAREQRLVVPNIAPVSGTGI